MSILIDKEIKEQVGIEGASWELVSSKFDFIEEKIISYGLSSFGYDARLADEFLAYNDYNGDVIDPYKITEDNFIKLESQFSNGKRFVIIPPGSFVLAKTLEKFKIPENVVSVCVGKSTYARCGIIVNVTPLEPGWEGHVTLELSNTTRLSARVYVNEGICQFLFFKSESRPIVIYSDRNGKYMNQTKVTPPRI
jgi:dCTP deaminase